MIAHSLVNPVLTTDELEAGIGTGAPKFNA